MGDSQNNQKKSGVNPILSSLLDFGPTQSAAETVSLSSSTDERLKRLVKQLEQINRRIDALSTRF